MPGWACASGRLGGAVGGLLVASGLASVPTSLPAAKDGLGCVLFQSVTQGDTMRAHPSTAAACAPCTCATCTQVHGAWPEGTWLECSHPPALSHTDARAHIRARSQVRAAQLCDLGRADLSNVRNKASWVMSSFLKGQQRLAAQFGTVGGHRGRRGGGVAGGHGDMCPSGGMPWLHGTHP